MEQLRDLLASAQDAMSVRRVFGDPIDKNDLTVIPAASIRGGAGGGAGKERGWGQGYGLTARPSGVYVVKGADVRWSPAVNVNMIILGGQIVAVIALLTVRAIVRARSRG